ncbi:MAG: NYN domain-containing protein [Tannerellaceae bacterium]|jgi:uncharacterized LabA/DUF88 family protein|nr:NYN domain-containing protein [Tannerellaceae bacterium]
MDKQKAIVYVDGFNFYYGLRSKQWRRFYWLDMVKFSEALLPSDHELVEVKYFSARQANPDKRMRQDAFFQANQLNPKFTLHLGTYMPKSIHCPFCKSIIHSYEEKETDVRIAIAMLADVYNKHCSTSLLISADSDLVPPIEHIRTFNPSHRIITCFPPNKMSFNLKKWSNATRVLSNQSLYESCILPEMLTLADGYELHRPNKWD